VTYLGPTQTFSLRMPTNAKSVSILVKTGIYDFRTLTFLFPFHKKTFPVNGFVRGKRNCDICICWSREIMGRRFAAVVPRTDL